MKKAVVFVVLAMVLVCSCAAQSASNDAQRIVGTWVNVPGTGDNITFTLVFNANGTGTFTYDGKTQNFNYGISAGGKIYSDIPYAKGTRDLFFSPDGKRMSFYDEFGWVQKK